jgi:glycosyltransferase involved in cell wall biosynthesis
LFLDPIKPLENGSHNNDVEWFVKNLLDNGSKAFGRGFTANECSSKSKIGYRLGTLFRLTVIALGNAFRAIKLARQVELTVFNPNEDPISLFILQKLRNVSRSNFTIKSRFICTRDRMLLRKDSVPVEYLKKKISSSVRNVDRLSAETITYSEFLSQEFGTKVEFVPYPPIDSRFNEEHVPIDDDLYVSLGSARKDKGFEALPVWIDQISQGNPKAHFVIQKASKEWDGYNKALEEISRFDNVRILPSHIDEKIQYKILAAANAFLAPYDQVTYQFRGSAFARRAMYLGKPICVTLGTSMSLDAERHNLLISQDSIVNELIVSKDHSTSQAVGVILQDEAIKIWRNFLL